MRPQIVTIAFESYEHSIPKALDAIGAGQVLQQQQAILIKPNLVTADPFPVTTPVECCAALVDYIRTHSKADLIIAEGSGDAVMETEEIFSALGYLKLSREKDVPLLDLNHAPLKRHTNARCTLFKSFYLPEVATTHYLISVPVLKAHSLADITGAMKNMIGFAPPKYYAGHYGHWKKARFHGDMHRAITELNRYRQADLSVLDASVGLSQYHLGGPHCHPPVNRIVAGYDPISVDRQAADLLGLNWRQIPHLTTPL